MVTLIGILSLISNLILLYLKYDEINLWDERFLQLNTCPYCFGFSLCQSIQLKESNSESDLEFLTPEYYTTQGLFNVKNVYLLIDNFKSKKLVLKKLAHNSELSEFDGENFIKNDQQLKEKLTLEIVKSFDIEFFSCFNQRLLDLLFNSYIEFNFNALTNSRKNSNIIFNKILISTLRINPEPIVLQVCYFLLIKFLENKLSYFLF